ncbi:MAG: glycerol acyltransferase [Flavobacteriales bacterium]|nr:glycerol acyltransferase [Flavobacteriales bacterium]
MNFDEIRPYRDDEVKEKIRKLLDEEQFAQVVSYVNPDTPFEQIKAAMLQMDSIKAFQSNIIVPMVERLVEKTTNGLEFEGLENLEKGKAYLFVSTHRDIVLDSAFMNYILLKQGYETAEIAIGDNLMTIPWVVDLVKLNKTFIVKRNVAKEDKVEASMQLSGYINETIKNTGESIWIAQRSGRSKDGNDETNPSLIKMFNLGGESNNALENIEQLNIVPVAISYEYNPCDVLTIPELMTVAKGERYEKAPMEDMIHMAKGIEGDKGRVAVSFGRPLNNFTDQLQGIKNRNQLLGAIADKIDEEIHLAYHLMPTNYIAWDLLNDSDKHKENYTAEERTGFQTYMESRITEVEGDMDEIRKTFLSMYANPVENSPVA